jgi:tetratricopeptide (TPR) repeat protein
VEGFLKERMTDSATAILEAWNKVDTSVTQPIAIQKARLASMLGKNAEALQNLRPYAVGVQPPIPVLSELALVHVKMGALDSAIRVYKAILDQNPPSKGSFLLLSHLLHLADKNPVKALELLKTLEVGVKDRLFQRSLVVTYLSIGQENKIKALIASEPDSSRRPLQAFRDGLEANQDYLGGWALFNYYQMNEQPFMMLRTLDSLYGRWPGNALIIRTYAGQLYAAGALPQALAVLGKLKNPLPEDEIRLLEINRRMGRTQEALAVAHRLEKANPGNRGINALLSDIYLARGETDQAIFHAERELAIDTGNVVCINNLAWIHGVTRGDLAKAEPYMRRLEKVKNSDPRVLDTIGWILARTGKLAEAGPYFDLALNILPDNASLLYHVGYLKAKQGDKAKASAYLKKALSLPGRFDERAEAQKLLAEQG